MKENDNFNNEEKKNSDNNDDMVDVKKEDDEHISFKVSEKSSPERSWSKNEKRAVWIIAIIITIIAVIAIFFLNLNGINFLIKV